MPTLPNSEKSLWRDYSAGILYPRLAEDIEVDVVVIGAGISGLTTAYLLKKAGLKVAVLEKDTVGGGTTGRTTGKVTSQHGIMYQELISQIGFKAAKLYAEANEAAVQLVAQIISTEKIACDWQQDDNYVFTDDPNNVDKFKEEANAAAQLGLPASFETSLSLPFSVKGAVMFSNQGKFASQKYVSGLAAVVHGQGSYVFENSPVNGIRDGNPCRVKTNKASIISKHIVVATNVPTLPLMARGGYCLLEYPTESYIVSAPYADELKGMYISPDKNHYSILPIDVDGVRRLLIGGGGHLSGLRGSKNWRFNRIASYAERHFDMTNITHKWSDRDYVAYDKIPLIGKLYPWSKNLYVATAFKKWGLSGGTMAGMILTDIITGNDNKAASIFTPQRIGPILSIPKAVIEQIKQLTSP